MIRTADELTMPRMALAVLTAYARLCLRRPVQDDCGAAEGQRVAADRLRLVWEGGRAMFDTPDRTSTLRNFPPITRDASSGDEVRFGEAQDPAFCSSHLLITITARTAKDTE